MIRFFSFPKEKFHQHQNVFILQIRLVKYAYLINHFYYLRPEQKPKPLVLNFLNEERERVIKIKKN